MVLVMRRFVTIIIALALMCVGGWFVWTNVMAIDHSEDPAPLPSHTFDDSTVKASGTTPKLAPNHISVPSLGINMSYHDSSVVNGTIQPELQIDDDPKIAVRWNGSTTRQGSQIFAAHVNDRAANLGPLVKINEAVPGTMIYVSDSEGKVEAYAATSLKAYTKANLDQSIFRAKGKREVHLVTCGGKIVRGSDGLFHHTDNVVLSGRAAPNSL